MNTDMMHGYLVICGVCHRDPDPAASEAAHIPYEGSHEGE